MNDSIIYSESIPSFEAYICSRRREIGSLTNTACLVSCGHGTRITTPDLIADSHYDWKMVKFARQCFFFLHQHRFQGFTKETTLRSFPCLVFL